MIHEIVTHLSPENFRERSAGKKIVLLYPWTNYRTLFLTHFITNHPSGLLYYRISDGEGSLTGWLNGMVTEFQQVLGSFGSQLRSALTKADPAGLAEALAADLAAYRKKKEQVVLFLDEFDRIPTDSSLETFVTALTAALPKNIQIAFSSRLLTYQPWYDLVVRGDAVVLGTETRKDEGMFTAQKQSMPQLEVYGLGRGYALVNGQLVTNWDGALPRNMFFFFMDRPLVTRHEIFDVFWPDLSIKDATNVFHVTKRKISERLGMKLAPDSSLELTRYGGGFYTPSTKLTRHYDVLDFQEAIERAMVTADEEEEERLLRQAVDACKAPFLQDTHMHWMVERREQLRQLNAQALISLGRIYKRRGDDTTALGYFVRSLKETPEREDIHREVMNVYLRLGRAEDARAQYHIMVDFLRTSYNIAPSRESKDLYKLIESA